MSTLLFDGPLPVTEIVLLVLFALATVVEWRPVAFLALGAFVVLFLLAVIERRVVDIALIAGLYFAFRFNLIESLSYFRYGSDLVLVVSAIAVLALLVMRSARLRWYDSAFIAFGVYSLVLGLVRDVPLTPALVQVRALLGVYPLFVLVREIGLDGAGSRRAAALAFYEFFAWTLFVQASIEKATGKLFFTTAFVRETVISVTNWSRVYGWTGNPNSLGALCVLLIGVGLLLAAWGFRGRWLNMGLTLYFATLVLSVSRSAMWGLAVLLVIMLFRRTFEGTARRVLGRLVARRFSIGLALAVVAILVGMVFPLITQAVGWTDEGFGIFGRFVTGEDEVESSIKGGRLFSLRTGVTIVTRGMDDALFGQGPATYGSAGSKFWESPLYKPYEIPEGFYADMFAVMMLVEVGIVGFALFALGLAGLLAANATMPLSWRLAILALLVLWSLFYNVPEIAMLYFPILVLMGVPLARPSEEQALAWSRDVWVRGVAA